MRAATGTHDATGPHRPARRCTAIARPGSIGLVAILIVAAIGCQRSAASDVVLSVTGTCSAAELAEVSQLSVNVYGTDPTSGTFCLLGKRCIPQPGPLTTPDQIAAILRDEKQPLVDVALAQAGWIEVVGHRQSCLLFDDHVMCGLGDLQSVDDDTLSIGLTCGACDTMELPFCP